MYTWRACIQGDANIHVHEHTYMNYPQPLALDDKHLSPSGSICTRGVHAYKVMYTWPCVPAYKVMYTWRACIQGDVHVALCACIQGDASIHEHANVLHCLRSATDRDLSLSCHF